jgi:hypothetical protein
MVTCLREVRGGGGGGYLRSMSKLTWLWSLWGHTVRAKAIADSLLLYSLNKKGGTPTNNMVASLLAQVIGELLFSSSNW